MIYLNIYFCENFLLFMTKFHHKYLHFLLPTFSKQTITLVLLLLKWLFFIIAHVLPSITRLISTAHIMHNRYSETKQRKKQDRTDMGRKRVLVSCNCRDLSAPHSYSSPPQILPPRDNLPTQNVDIWQSENETQQPTIFVVCLGSAQTNHPLSLIVLT